MDKNQPNTEKLSDLESFKLLSSHIRPKSAGGALNLTRKLHELVAEDIYSLEQEGNYDAMLKLYEFIVNRLDKLKSETSGGVKGFISASLDYWQKMLDEKKPELIVRIRIKKEASPQGQSPDKGRSENRRVIIRLGIGRRSDNRLKGRSEKRPSAKQEQKIDTSFPTVEIRLSSETNVSRKRTDRTIGQFPVRLSQSAK